MTDNELKEKIKSTFDDVADGYDSIDLFKISAENVAELLRDDTLEHALDVASGTGNVVLTCAKFLPGVSFDALDISSEMLKVAKQKAEAANLSNVTFHCSDIESLDMAKKYDVITCSYALFFLPNPIDTVKRLYSHLKEGGKLIFTSFTADAFHPSSKILLDLLESYGVTRPTESWQDLQNEEDIDYLCKQAGINTVEVIEKAIRYPLSIEKWWALNNSTAYRGLLKQLSAESYDKLKDQYFDAMKKESDNDLSVELIADTYYVTIRRES
ncbi:MAG: class I SAM-dependent methyltransferase [Sulfurimonadaceae bacterium]